MKHWRVVNNNWKRRFFAVLAIATTLVFFRALDHKVLFKEPVDISKLPSNIVKSLDHEPRLVKAYSQGQRPICPGPECPLNPGFDTSDFTRSPVYPMIDKLINKDSLNGTLYYRIETTAPEFTEAYDSIEFDVLGVYGNSWRLFVNGQLIKELPGGAMNNAVTIPTNLVANGQPLVLGVEIEIGDFLAPGFFQVSQVFLSAPGTAPMVRSAYRSFDLTVVTPVVYAFAAVGILIAIGSFFTLYVAEPILFSMIAASWVGRQLFANAIIPSPSFITEDFASLDAGCKVLLYGSLVAFFNHYFRIKQSWDWIITCFTILAACATTFSTQLGLPVVAFAVIKHQNFLLAITFAICSCFAFHAHSKVKNLRNTYLRKIVISCAIILLPLFSAAFLLRHVAIVAFPELSPVVTSYAARQIFSSWAMIIVIGIGIAIALEWALVVMERQRILQRFGMIVDKKLLQEITAPERLASKKCNDVIMMFIDMRSFTAMAEQRPAEEVVATLNVFVSTITKAIQDHGGVIDKLLGDGVMAFWGIPTPNQTDVVQALKATDIIAKELAITNARRQQVGLSPIQYGIGIHSGAAIFGAIGSEDFIDYTAIGPAVNIASRVQDLTKSLNACVLITESVATRLPEQHKGLTSLGSHSIRGISAAMELFSYEHEPASTMENLKAS